jgi:hypothetical protein
MANIPVYDQPNIALHPTEQGIEARVQSAYRGGGLYNRAGQTIAEAGVKIGSGIASAGAAAVDFLQHREISAGAKNDADMFANLTDNWNAVTKDPNLNLYDPTIAKSWLDQTLEPTLEQFQKGFITEGGQKWAEQRIDQLRQHFFEKTSADMSRIAGEAAESTAHDITNKFSNTAMRDPSAVPFLLDSVDHSISSIVASSPYLKGADAAQVRLHLSQKIKEEIVKSAMYGAIQNASDPEAAAKAWADKYPQYVNGLERETFAKAAKVQSRVLAAAEKQNLVYTRELANQQVAAERNKIWSENVNVDPNGKVTINPQFFHDAAALPGKYQAAPSATETAKTLIDWAQAQQAPRKVITDKAVLRDLVDRMTDADNPTTELEVLRAEADHKINHTDEGAPLLEMVRSLQKDPIKNPVWNDTKQAVKDYFTTKGTPDDPMGSVAFARFMQVFLPEYQKENREGKIQPNALDLRDPTSLIRRSMAQAPFNASLTDTMKRLGAGQSAFTPPQGQGWQFSQSRRQYRDKNGNLYDINGQPVK